MQRNKAENLAQGFLDRAYNKLDESRRQLEAWHYAESVSASQECIELSMKASFLLLEGGYRKTHEFSQEQFEQILTRVPQDLQYHDFARLYLLHRFWAGFYTAAKYGYEKLGIPAKDLFEKDEAALATRHAEKWYYAAKSVVDSITYAQEP